MADKPTSSGGLFDVGFPDAFSKVVALGILFLALTVISFNNFFTLDVVYLVSKYIPLSQLLLAISIVIALILFMLAFYYFSKTHSLDATEKLQWYENLMNKSHEIDDIHKIIMSRWERILSLLEDQNPNAWKVAIIDSDIMAEDILRNEGLSGETMADILKSISKSEFALIDDLWAAHKYRNRVAHSSEELRKEEVDEAITKFGKVFRNLKYID